MYVRLDAPPLHLAQREKEVAEVEQFFKARKVKLGKTKIEKLERRLKKIVESWEEGTTDLHAKLAERNEFFEGKPEDVDFPFGAGQSSNVDIRLAAARSRTLRAHFIRLVFADTSPFVAELLPGAKRENEDNLAEAHVNWSVSKETNGLEILKDTPIPCFRDGLGLTFGEWERRVESGMEYRTYENREMFEADYPSAKDAGCTEEEYAQVLEELESPDSEVHVEFEIDFVAQNGPVYTLVPLSKFIWGPLSARDLRLTAEAYGYYHNQSGTAFEADARKGFYDADAVTECRKKSGTMDRDAWDATRDAVDGIDALEYDRVSYKIAKLVVCQDLNGDAVPERYMVWWDMESNKALRVERYGLHRNVPNIVPFRFIKRDNRLIGVSLLGDAEPLLRSINALHRHRSNVRRLTDTVTLVIPKRLKEDVDLGAEYSEFKPGMTLWMPDDIPAEKYPKQLQIHNTSRNSDSMDEESLLVRYLDGLFGISEGQSGRETPLDPSAPASKTRMLLERADLRIEDLVEEWRRSIPDFIELHNALFLQNARASLKFMLSKDGKQAEAEIRTAQLADPFRRYVLKAVRPSVTPEFEMNKIMALVAAAFQMKFPIQAKPQMIVEAWNDFVTASRIALPERFQIQMEDPTNPAAGMSMGGAPVDMQQILGMIQSMGAAAGQPQPKPDTKPKPLTRTSK